MTRGERRDRGFDEKNNLAHRIRAHGYESRCQRFKSLLAHPKREQNGGPFGGRDIMIGIADIMIGMFLKTFL
jgi:hypothetical protein